MIVGSVSRQSAAAAAAPAPPQQQQQEAPQKQQQQQQQNQGQQSRDQNQGQQNQSQGQNRNQQNQDKDHQLEHGDSRPSPKGRAPYTQNEPFNIGAGGDELPQDRTNTRGPAGQRPANNANSQTYSHFEFDDDNEHAPPAMASRKQTAGQGAHQSTWDYESPEMPVNTRPANTRPAQGGNNNGRPSNVDSALNNARRNEGHSFEFGDSSSPPTDKGAPRAGKGDSNRSGYQWTQQKNAQDDDNGFFGGFGKESTTGGIHIAGNGQGQSKSVTKNWGWDQEAEQVGQRGQQQQQQRGGNQQDQQRGGNQQQQQSNQQQQSGQRGLAQKAKADEEEEKGFWDY